MTVHMLTTVDNPFDPFTDFDEWNAYDMSLGYHTMAFLARVASSSHDLSEADQEWAIEQAVQEIARENVSGVHRLVAREDKQEVTSSSSAN